MNRRPEAKIQCRSESNGVVVPVLVTELVTVVVIVVVGVVTSQFDKPPARCASVIWFSMVAVTLPSVSSNRYLPRKHCTSNVGDAGPENSRNASDSTLAVASQLETTVSTARLGAPYSAMFSHPMVARAELIGPQLSSTELITAA